MAECFRTGSYLLKTGSVKSLPSFLLYKHKMATLEGYGIPQSQMRLRVEGKLGGVLEALLVKWTLS